MPAPHAPPSQLCTGPFSRREALARGVTSKMLQGKRFVRLFPEVYALRTHVMSELDWIRAATLTLPDDARLSHLTRLRVLGLDFGSQRPMHFTIQGDLHIDLPGIFLHRTICLPACDAEAVSVEFAFIGFATDARTIDLIKVGDWLLHRGHMSLATLTEALDAQPWRLGAEAARAVAPYLCARSRSLKESELRVILVFAGLPLSEVNKDLHLGGRFIACVDLYWDIWRLVVEYEGRQHAEDIAQWNRDLDRYADLRRGVWAYEQVTQENLRNPRQTALRVHDALVRQGYVGPAPVFGGRWRSLFEAPRRAGFSFAGEPAPTATVRR